jgi:hypothetical protein
VDGVYSTTVPPGRGRLVIADPDAGSLVGRDLDVAPGALIDLGVLAAVPWRTLTLGVEKGVLAAASD